MILTVIEMREFKEIWKSIRNKVVKITVFIIWLIVIIRFKNKRSYK